MNCNILSLGIRRKFRIVPEECFAGFLIVLQPIGAVIPDTL